MTYLCGLLSCEVKCQYYPEHCGACDKSHYSPVSSPNVVCYPDLPAEDDTE